jgi:hypothetical protein
MYQWGRWRNFAILIMLLSGIVAAMAGTRGSLAEAMRQIGEQWERIAGAVLFDPSGARHGVSGLAEMLQDLHADGALNRDMRHSLLETREALLRLERLLHERRHDEAWAQRLAVERLCEQCHQEYRLATIMRRLTEEYNQVADAFVRGRYDRVVEGMYVFQGQTEWFRRWVSPAEGFFHEEAQRLIDLAHQVAQAAQLRDRSRTQQLLQQLIDSCPACHTIYRDTGRWRELAKRY